MSFEDLVGAIRAADGNDSELAAATQLRVRRSLETRARTRHQLVGILTAVGILFAGTMSWALATGHMATLWSPRAIPALTPVIERPAPRTLRHAAAAIPPPAPSPEAIAADLQPALAPETQAPAQVAPPPAPDAPPIRTPVRRPAAPPVEALYRRAHELHFHGGSPAATLAAWNAYLAAEPDGRFSLDARYNRALVLIRLGRYAEARAALLPFALGTASPDGYRQPEAEQLVERLAHYE